MKTYTACLPLYREVSELTRGPIKNFFDLVSSHPDCFIECYARYQKLLRIFFKLKDTEFVFVASVSKDYLMNPETENVDSDMLKSFLTDFNQIASSFFTNHHGNFSIELQEGTEKYPSSVQVIVVKYTTEDSIQTLN